MAFLRNASMALSSTAEQVTISVAYDVRFGSNELATLSTGSPALWFTEVIEVLGAKYPLTLGSDDLTPSTEWTSRSRSASFPREYFDLGALPATVRCRIRIRVSPPVETDLETNTAVVDSRVVWPYVPWRRYAATGAAAGGVVALGLAARSIVLRARARPDPG